MSSAFGDARVIGASEEAKTCMRQLYQKGIFREQRDVWMLGAALGIASGRTHEGENRDTFQNINSLDPEGVFAALMVGQYPELKPDERLKRLVDHAEWGIREIFRKHEKGTLDWATLGLSTTETDKKD
jgi:hypothetical protein